MNALVHSTRHAVSMHVLAGWARWLHRVLRSWRAARREAAERRAFDALDDAAVRDLGMSRSEYDSFWTELRGLAPRTRVRAARPLQPDAWL
jgi:uncharacterized protein YjiS (DUF1127 family)